MSEPQILKITHHMILSYEVSRVGKSLDRKLIGGFLSLEMETPLTKCMQIREKNHGMATLLEFWGSRLGY